MAKDFQEWLKQAEYDLETAEVMFKGNRYFYAVFMCHLAVEKALKGIYYKKFNEVPPKTHNIVFLISKTEINPPEDIGRFLIKINQASIVTRYPEDLAKLQGDYTATTVQELLSKTKEAMAWIKKIF
jgi:HEPN domain-containing protein